MPSEQPSGADPSAEKLWQEIKEIHENVDVLAQYDKGKFFAWLPQETQDLWASIEIAYNVAESPFRYGEEDIASVKLPFPQLKEKLENLQVILRAEQERYMGKEPN